jgi:hypothetical protein
MAGKLEIIEQSVTAKSQLLEQPTRVKKAQSAIADRIIPSSEFPRQGSQVDPKVKSCGLTRQLLRTRLRRIAQQGGALSGLTK